MIKITSLSALLRGTAAAAALALPLGTGAFAQEQQPQQDQNAQAAQPTQQREQPAQPSQQGEQQAQPTQQGEQQAQPTQQGEQQAQPTQQEEQQAQPNQQQGQTTDPGQPEQQQTADPAQAGQQPGETAGAPAGEPRGETAGAPAGQGLAADALVATVGDAEIRGADVLRVIGQLPEPLRAQQPDMLVPIALDQLILRELILQEAMRENLAEDPEVVALVEQSSAEARDEAMVHVWLRREFDEAIDDEAARRVYDDLAATSAEELPPFEQVQPQIDQHLRQQTLGEIRDRLRQNAAVTLYGPGGQPLEQSGDAQSSTGGQASPDQGQATSDAAPQNNGEQSQEGATEEQQGTSNN